MTSSQSNFVMAAAHPKGRRYSVQVMNRARELRAGGWQLDRVADMLEQEFGVRPSIDTISIWTCPERARSATVSHGAAMRRFRNRSLTGRMPNSRRFTLDFRLIRAKALRDAGLSVNAIAKVMSFDFPHDPVDEHQVRYALRVSVWPSKSEVLR